jgi:opacity protein-like surface antigen
VRTAVALGYLCNILESNDEALQQFVLALAETLATTGGLAYGHLAANAPLVPMSWGSTRAGWTVGAGAEAAIDRNWLVKVEYLYMDLGNIGSSGA